MQVAATPRGLPEPGPPPNPEKTLSRWHQFLGSIAAGVSLPDAMLKHYMTRADIESCVRLSNEERQRYDDARVTAAKRTWSVHQFEDIFASIAGGTPIKKSIEAVRGSDVGGDGYAEFNRIIVSDTVLNEQYMTALKCRSLVMQDDILVIADDDKDDVLYGEKGPISNGAAVNRAKLRVETRRALMGAWNTKMFGEGKNQVQVNVQVNHAQRLEEARARAKQRSGTPSPKITQEIVEAAFREVPARIPPIPKPDHDAVRRRVEAQQRANDTSWMDEAPKEDPLSTAWLEEK